MKYIENKLPLLQYQVESISINNPTGMEVERIENMTSVRDISWQDDSDHITITTDDQVHNIIIARTRTTPAISKEVLHPSLHLSFIPAE